MVGYVTHTRKWETMSNAIQLETLEEHTIGSEDRVFRADSGWYWQCRGYSDCCGPFKTRKAATTDYYELDDTND